MTNISIRRWLPVLGFCLIIAGKTTKAQSQEFSFSVAGGLGGAQYKVANGSAALKPAFQVGLGYMRSFHARWGIRAGVELGMYQSKASLHPNTLHTSYEVDSENDAFEYRVRTSGYREGQKLYTVNIPLILQFHPKFNENGFYGQVGVKLGLPVSNKFKTKADEITAAGYYPDFNLEINDLPQHGFGRQSDWKRKGEYDFKTSWSLAAEMGMRFKLSAKSNIYIGFFVDYGLNNIKKKEGNEMLMPYQPNGLAESQAKGIFSLKEETGDAKLIAYGLKLRVGMGSNKKEKKKPVEVIASIPVKQDTQVAVVVAPVEKDTTPVKISEVPIVEVAVKDTLTAEEQKILETPFLFGKVGDTSLSDAGRQQALAVATILKAHPEVTVIIEGHTCNIGSDQVNEKIGLARANAVAAILQSNGVASDRLQPLSRGSFEPVAPNDTEAGRRKNRRVVVKIM